MRLGSRHGASASSPQGSRTVPRSSPIVTGLPAGLRLDRDAIDADLRRRQQGYGRSPRQQLETDEVEVLSGLRHARTLGTPLTLVVRNRDHKNWTWGMSPWPPEGEPHGKGTKPVTLPRPGHADLAGVLKYGHDDVRNALERASARHTAAHVAAGRGREGAPARDRDRRRGPAARDRRRARRRRHARGDRRGARRTATRSAASSRSSRPACPPGLGSYAEKRERLDARLACGAHGHPGREGRRDRRRLRARPACAAPRRTTRSTPGSRGGRTAPAASRRGSRTASRSSSAPR